MKFYLLFFFTIITLSSCNHTIPEKKLNISINNESSTNKSDSLIIFNPFDSNIKDFSIEINNLRENEKLELKNNFIVINEDIFESLNSINNKDTSIQNISNDNKFIYTDYGKIVFKDNPSEGDDIQVYKVLGYIKDWKSYVIGLELYAGGVFFIINNNNNNYSITEFKGEKPYINEDGKLFLIYYTLEEGLGNVYQIFGNNNGKISNIKNFWSDANTSVNRVFWFNNELYIEIEDYSYNNKLFYKGKF